MKPVAKVFLIGCGTVVFLGLVFVAVSVWYLRAHGPELMAKGDAATAEGAQAGVGQPESVCVDGMYARYAKNKGIMGAIEAKVFLEGCLGASTPAPGFCEGVPDPGEIIRSSTWRVEQCDARGFAGDSGCPNLMSGVQDYCANPPQPAPAYEPPPAVEDGTMDPTEAPAVEAPAVEGTDPGAPAPDAPPSNEKSEKSP